MTCSCLIALLVFLSQQLVCFSQATAAKRARLILTAETSGKFSIRFDEGRGTNSPLSIELQSGETRIGPYSSAEGTLVQACPAIASEGQDVFGFYEGMTWSWAFKEDPGTIRVETTIRSYPRDDPGILLFEQHFPIAVNTSAFKSTQNSSSWTLFPSFQRNPGPTDYIKTFSYHGVFCEIQHGNMSNYRESHQGGAPLVMYDKSAKELPTLVFSPLNVIKASHMATSNTSVGGGIKATVDYIPERWTQRFILSAGYGINDGMMAWGDRMMKYHGVKERSDLYRDAVHAKIGFWTDNGGYYHYSLGNVSKSSTYEEVLPKVKQYHDAIGVPFGHWQFDSWFYPKDGPVNKGGGGGAVVNWTAMDKVFPSGMAGIQSKLQVPMVMHNRQWSVQNDYIKKWPDIEWYIPNISGHVAAIPKDPLVFFKRFFTTMDGWGLSMYEQDWMCQQYDICPILQSNISLGDLWLSGMAEGAMTSNRTVQYCMPYPNDVLSAVQYPAVTNARASGDYTNEIGIDQWNIPPTSLFYWAIGILPFKDGFYSSSVSEIGGQNMGPEENPDREIIMATLSGAMVGPMDGIYLLNKTRVMASCNGAGYILKPDRPATPPDYCFSHYDNPSHCQISVTFSDIQGYGRVHYVFDNAPTGYYLPCLYDLSSSSPYVIYNWYTQTITEMSSNTTLLPGYEGHSYAVVAPVIAGWVFLGEIDKYVTVSNVRFVSVTKTGQHKITALVRGTARESVRVCATDIKNDVLGVVCQSLLFQEAGTKMIAFPPPSRASVSDI